MPKKKKKNKNAQQKAMYVAHTNRQTAHFVKKLNDVAEALGAGHIIRGLPDAELRFLYTARFRPIRVESMPGVKWSPQVISSIQTMVNTYLNNEKMTFPGSDREFSLMDYFTIVLTLNHWLRAMDRRTTPQRAMYIDAFKVLLDFCSGPDRPEYTMRIYTEMIGNCLSEPGKTCFYLKWVFISRQHPRPYAGEVLQLHAYKPDKKSIQFQRASRTIYRLHYIGDGGPRVLSMKAGLLNPGCPVPDMQLEVYFQNHALDRLRERIDCADFNVSYVEMCRSFLNPEVISQGELRGLVSFYLLGMKLGYFIVEAREGIVTIRTFLFLTNDGTPEGDKLRKHLGLAQEDKQYTGLDRLSTFLLSDIRKDQELCEVLHKTGCGVLLDADLQRMARAGKVQQTRSAASIRRYLMLDDEVRQVS